MVSQVSSLLREAGSLFQGVSRSISCWKSHRLEGDAGQKGKSQQHRSGFV